MLLSINMFVSLDGVVQGPGAPDEDRSGDFDRGGWVVPFASASTDEVVTQWFEKADAFLLGRTTFEMLRGYWPEVTDERSVIASQLNSLPKYVVSSTLSDAAADWPVTTVVTGELVSEVQRLKDRPGGELQVHGSWALVRSLHEAGLVDVYRMLVYPVVVGGGKRLFPDGALPASFSVAADASRVLPGGVVSLTLTPEHLGSIQAGAYVVDEGRSVPNA